MTRDILAFWMGLLYPSSSFWLWYSLPVFWILSPITMKKPDWMQLHRDGKMKAKVLHSMKSY